MGPFLDLELTKVSVGKSALTVCRKSIAQASGLLGCSGFEALPEGRINAALRLPVRWQRIDAKPFCGEAQGLIALDDQFEDVRGEEGQVDDLHDPPLGEVLVRCDLSKV